MSATPSEPTPRRITTHLLRLFSDVHANEVRQVLILTATVFLLLVSYYILKTVREPLVLASASDDLEIVRTATWMPTWMAELLTHQLRGAQRKALAAACQALLLCVFVPSYATLAARVNRRTLLIGVSVFFIAGMEAFFLLRLLHVPMLGFFFYIWLGVFSVAMIAQFWAFANDLYSEEAGKRLFPIIGIGATLGAPLGSKIADGLFRYLGDNPLGIDPAFIMLQLPALLLTLFTAVVLFVASDSTRTAPDSKDASTEPLTSRASLRLIRQSPYLMSIAGIIIVLNLVNTTGEFMLSEWVVRAANDAVLRDPNLQVSVFIGQFYGDFYFYVNLGAFVLQALFVSRLVKHTGMYGILLALPFVALGTYTLFGLGLGLAALRLAKMAENATDYSIMNMGRAMLWLPTAREAKYNAKQAIDTLGVRLGDVGAALLFLTTTLGLAWDIPTLSWVVLALIVLWIGLTLRLLRQTPKSETSHR